MKWAYLLSLPSSLFCALFLMIACSSNIVTSTKNSEQTVSLPSSTPSLFALPFIGNTTLPKTLVETLTNAQSECHISLTYEALVPLNSINNIDFNYSTDFDSEGATVYQAVAYFDDLASPFIYIDTDIEENYSWLSFPFPSQSYQYNASATGIFVTAFVVKSGDTLCVSDPVQIRIFDPSNPPKPRGPLGMNLNGITDYSTDMPFVDVFKSSRKWMTSFEGGPWDTKVIDDIPKDENGYPLSLPYPVTTYINNDGIEVAHGPANVHTLMQRELKGHYPGGLYTCLYDGEGEITVGFDGYLVESSPGRLVIDVHPSDAGISLRIRQSQLGNHIRNIRCLLPGHEQSYENAPFNPEFLATFADFSLFRYLGWQRTNGQQLSQWSDRTRPNHYTQSRDEGAAIEYMIELANAAGVDPWFCLPHLATDEFITEHAKMVFAKLRSDLTAYFEFSNETWNFAGPFTQTQDMIAIGTNNGYGSGVEAAHHMSAQRTAEMGEILALIYGDQRSRYQLVLGTQGADPAVGIKRLDWTVQTRVNPDSGEPYGTGEFAGMKVHEVVDVLAGGGYFSNNIDSSEIGQFVSGPTDASGLYANAADLDVDLDHMFQFLETTALPETLSYTSTNVINASNRGVRYVAYEGGQHVVGLGSAVNNAQLNQLLEAMQSDPRMKDLYLSHLNNWKSTGAHEFLHLGSTGFFSKWGGWSALEYLGQPLEDAPKFEALLEFIEVNSPVWW